MAKRDLSMSKILEDVKKVATRSARARFVAENELKTAQKRFNTAQEKLKTAQENFDTAVKVDEENQTSIEKLNGERITFQPENAENTDESATESADGESAPESGETEPETVTEPETDETGESAPETVTEPETDETDAKPVRARRGHRVSA
jgi:D-hexose-6-phosphate mutarotase